MSRCSAIAMCVAVPLLAGCGGRAAASSAQPNAPAGVFVADTVRGIAAITGSEPLTTVQLTTTDGRTWQLVGDSLAAVRAAAGLDIMVIGVVVAADSSARPSARFEVVRFVVRAADGIPAQDGVLERDDAGFTLRLDGGRRAPLALVPTPLRALIGARIWWAGPLDRPPTAYGVLTARR